MREIEFGSLTAIDPSPPAVKVGGRVFKGPIRIGDVFHVVRSSLKEANRVVELTVVSISLYGYDVTEVDPMMTPLLTLAGEGASELEDGAVLTA
jgi:hypothetical protein